MKRISAITAGGMIMIVFLISLIYAGEIIIHRTIDIVGASVRSLEGEVFGRVIELEHDNVTGDILFAVLAPDQGIGLCGRVVPVPIGALQFRNNSESIIKITREKLVKAPTLVKGKRPDMSNRQWSEDTYRFYGMRPYWKDQYIAVR